MGLLVMTGRVLGETVPDAFSQEVSTCAGKLDLISFLKRVIIKSITDAETSNGGE